MPYLMVIVVLIATALLYVLLTKQLRTIHRLVNSNLARVQADLKIALDRISVLEQILSKDRR